MSNTFMESRAQARNHCTLCARPRTTVRFQAIKMADRVSLLVRSLQSDCLNARTRSRHPATDVGCVDSELLGRQRALRSSCDVWIVQHAPSRLRRTGSRLADEHRKQLLQRLELFGHVVVSVVVTGLHAG